MTKPTTEELAKDCERIAFRFSDNIGDSNVDDLHLAAKRLRELERENAEMRAALEMCIPWTEVAIDKMDSTPLAMGRLEKVRGFKKLLKEDS